MPLKIRCPHCMRTLVADDDVAGETKKCPACGEFFNVPLPKIALGEREPTSRPGRLCPRCGEEVGPTATICRGCATDLATGKRLPWKRRIALLSWRFWTISGVTVVILIIAVFAGVQLYQIRTQPPTDSFTPAAPHDIPADAVAAALLDAATRAARLAALDALRPFELRAMPAVAAALAESLAEPPAHAEQHRNQRAAIRLLARNAHAHPDKTEAWLGILARAQEIPELRAAALRARGMLGDQTIATPLVELWLTHLRELLALEQIVRVAQMDDEAAARQALRKARDKLRAVGEGLQALAEQDRLVVFAPLTAAFWESWQWVGQARGERFAEEVFNLARPTERALEFQPEDVRQPRETMKAVAQHADPAARAAAGVILTQRAPQYRTRREEIADILADLLANCDAADQQRLTWSIARLREKLFGVEPRVHPLDVTRDEIAAAQRWGTPTMPAVLKDRYPTPPRLTYRAVTSDRLLEQDLLADLRADWSLGLVAADYWLAADLGVTPRLRELVDPTQRNPNYAALAAGLVLAAELHAHELRPELDLWREAREQPAWVRSLAATSLAALDLQRGRTPRTWPADLEFDNEALLDTGRPGWVHFGRAIAAGGRNAIACLENSATPRLADQAREQLIEAARTAWVERAGHLRP